MKFIFATLILILFSSNSQAQSTLRFDGYYYAFDNAQNDSSWHYLRFYPDGSVIEVNSVARPGKLMKGFKKGSNPNMFQGTYSKKNADLQFSVFDKMKQKIVYKGTISNKQLKLRVHSYVSGYEGDETYLFVPVKGLD